MQGKALELHEWTMGHHLSLRMRFHQDIAGLDQFELHIVANVEP